MLFGIVRITSSARYGFMVPIPEHDVANYTENHKGGSDEQEDA